MLSRAAGTATAYPKAATTPTLATIHSRSPKRVEVTITLESEIDSYLFLLKESGEITAENDDIDRNSLNYNSRVTSTIRYYLSITSTLGPGDYTIAATTFDEFETGEFTLIVTGIGYLDDRATLTAPIPRH